MASDVLHKLIEGNRQFRETYFNNDTTLYHQLVLHGQRPKIMVVACSDSRVDPALIFNCQPGELFVVRNVANLVPPCEAVTMYHGTSAAIEFGVRVLQVEHVIVLGHTQCSGIHALMRGVPQVEDHSYGFISKWLELARPAYHQVMKIYHECTFEQQVNACERFALRNSLHNLRTFEWISQRCADKQLTLHAWHFDLSDGSIARFDESCDAWLTS